MEVKYIFYNFPKLNIFSKTFLSFLKTQREINK